MASEGSNLKILFFPFMAQGHMIPMVNMAKLFATRGVSATIITTLGNVNMIQPFINSFNDTSVCPIQLHLIPFPSAEVGLPEGCENISSVPSPNLVPNFFIALGMLRKPFDVFLRWLVPDCVVSDMFFPWTYGLASELDIPRLTFHGMNFFSLSVSDSMLRNRVYETVLADDVESFVIPGIPHQIKMLRSQLQDPKKAVPEIRQIMTEMVENDGKSYGAVVNSFYELEPEYAHHYRNVVQRAWHVGPLALCNNDKVDKYSARENVVVSADRIECMQWLDGQSASSVVYVCFGSISQLINDQLFQIATGLESTNHPFIWVVRKVGNDWNIPKGFEEKIKGRGLIIRGWAPQVQILNHPAVGGFVTHCGWNSCLEGITAGLPLITFPQFAEQFFNERLIVDVLKIGVAVGVKEFSTPFDEVGSVVVGASMLAKAVESVMGVGEEAEDRRRRARELGEAAKKAVDKGGSSYIDVTNLIEELMDRRSAARGSAN